VDTGCGWLKQLKRFTAVLAFLWLKKSSFEMVFIMFQLNFNCVHGQAKASYLRTLLFE